MTRICVTSPPNRPPAFSSFQCIDQRALCKPFVHNLKSAICRCDWSVFIFQSIPYNPPLGEYTKLPVPRDTTWLFQSWLSFRTLDIKPRWGNFLVSNINAPFLCLKIIRYYQASARHQFACFQFYWLSVVKTTGFQPHSKALPILFVPKKHFRRGPRLPLWGPLELYLSDIFCNHRLKKQHPPLFLCNQR